MNNKQNSEKYIKSEKSDKKTNANIQNKNNIKENTSLTKNTKFVSIDNNNNSRKKNESKSNSKFSLFELTINEFSFIYNLYLYFYYQNTKNDLLPYYFISNDWFTEYQSTYQLQDIFNILNYIYKTDNFKIQLSLGKIPPEIKRVKFTTKLKSLNFEAPLIKIKNIFSYFNSKIIIINEDLKNNFYIENKNQIFKNLNLKGILQGLTFYLVLPNNIIEIFLFSESDYYFFPFCFFFYEHQSEMKEHLMSYLRYKEIKEIIAEMSLYNKNDLIIDKDKNVIGKIIYINNSQKEENIQKLIDELIEKDNKEKEEMIEMKGYELKRRERSYLKEIKKEKEKKEKEKKNEENNDNDGRGLIDSDDFSEDKEKNKETNIKKENENIGKKKAIKEKKIKEEKKVVEEEKIVKEKIEDKKPPKIKKVVKKEVNEDDKEIKHKNKHKRHSISKEKNKEKVIEKSKEKKYKNEITEEKDKKDKKAKKVGKKKKKK